MHLKNLFILLGFLLVNTLSSFALSPFRHLPVNQNDTSLTKKPVVISEMDQNRMMLLDATVELDQALLAGVNASLDTINAPVKFNTAKKDTFEKLREMKRLREHNEMKVYLDYMKDSLTKECAKLTKEKEAIQIRLGLIVAQKTEPASANKQPEENKNPVAKNNNQPVASLPAKKPEPPVNIKAAKDTITAKLPDKNKTIPDAAGKKDKKHSKQNKNVTAISVDTAHIAAPPVATAMNPAPKTKNVSSPDTSGQRQLPPVVKTVVADNNVGKTNPVSASPGVVDTATRIKSLYLVAYAQKAIVEKEYTKASDYLKSSVELWPDNYDAWYTKADFEIQQHHLDKAMEAYQHCYRIDPTKPKLSYEMALLDLRSNNKPAALFHLNKAISLDGNFIFAYMKRGAIYNDTAKYNEAIADFNHVLQININYYPAYKGLGIAKLMQRKYKDAIDDFTRYIIYDQSDAEVYYYRGIAKINNNEWLDGCLELSMSANMGYAAAAVAQKKNCE